MIILETPAGYPAPQAYNLEQLINIGAAEATAGVYLYILQFTVPADNEGSQQYTSVATFATAQLAVSAAVTLLQSLPLVSILSTLNLVETITLT